MIHKLRKILLTLFVGAMSIYALSDGPSMPEFAQFAQFDAKDLVDLNTGNFKYTVPILTVPGKGSGFPIAMGYHSGIRYNQEASWVGLGWSLNAGAINRMVREYADDYYDANIESYYKKILDQGTILTVGGGYGPYGGSVTYDNTSSGLGVMGSFDVTKILAMYAPTSAVSAALANTNLSPSLSVNIGVSTGGDFVMDVKAGVGVNLGTGQMGLHVSAGTSGINAGGGYSNGLMNLSGNIGGSGFSGSMSLGSGSTNVGYSWNSSGAGSFGYSVAGFTSMSQKNSATSAHVQSKSGSFTSTIPLGTSGAWISFGSYWWETRVQHISQEHVYGFLYQGGAPNRSEALTRSGSSWFDDDDFIWTSYDKGSTLERHAKGGARFSSQDIYICNGVGVSGSFMPYALNEIQYLDAPDKKIDGQSYDRSARYKWYSKEPLNVDNNFNALLNHNGVSQDINSSNIQFKFVGESGKNFVQNGINGYSQIEAGTGITGKKIIPIINDAYRLVGFNVVDIDGKVYEYHQPLMNVAQLSYTSDSENEMNKDHYSAQTNFQPYAYTWLVTAIKSPDYVDKTGDGYSDDDLGYWVKMSYQGMSSDDSEPYLYTWQAPYNYKEYINGNYTVSIGSKENLFLKSVETATHIAEFSISDRIDAFGKEFTDAYNSDVMSIGFVNNDSPNKVFTQVGRMRRQYENRLYKYKKSLDKIELWKKGKGENHKIKEVNFSYNYSNCHGIPNVDQEKYEAYNLENGLSKQPKRCGKLTLSSFQTTVYKHDGTEQKMPPYKFVYQKANPSFRNSKDYDIWGMYSPLGDVNKHITIQDSATGVHWNLERITTPTGTEIYVDYERDQYFGASGDKLTALEMDIEGKYEEITLDEATSEDKLLILFNTEYTSTDYLAVQYKLKDNPQIYQKYNVGEYVNYNTHYATEAQFVGGKEDFAKLMQYDGYQMRTYLKQRGGLKTKVRLHKTEAYTQLLDDLTESASSTSDTKYDLDFNYYVANEDWTFGFREEVVKVEGPLSKPQTSAVKVYRLKKNFNFWGGDTRVANITTKNMLGSSYRTEYLYNEYESDGKTLSEKSSGRTFRAPNYIHMNGKSKLSFGCVTPDDDENEENPTPLIEVYVNGDYTYYAPDPGIQYHTVTVRNVEKDANGEYKPVAGSYVYKFYSPDDSLDIYVSSNIEDGEYVKRGIIHRPDYKTEYIGFDTEEIDLIDYTSILGRTKSITVMDVDNNVVKYDSIEYRFSDEGINMAQWNDGAMEPHGIPSSLGIKVTQDRVMRRKYVQTPPEKMNGHSYKFISNNVYQTGMITKAQGLEVKVSNSCFDPITGTPLTTYSESPNVPSEMTVVKPAYVAYPDMAGKNMFTQTYSKCTWIDNNSAAHSFNKGEAIKDASITQWRKFIDNGKPRWIQDQTWTWFNPNDEETDLAFDHEQDNGPIDQQVGPLINNQWIRSSVVDKFNGATQPVQEYDVNMNPSCALYSHNGTKLVAGIKNAKASEVRFCDLEPGNEGDWYRGEWDKLYIDDYDTTQEDAFTGRYSAKCIYNQYHNMSGPGIDIPLSDLSVGKKYIFTAAIKATGETAFAIINPIDGAHYRLKVETKIKPSGEWQIIEVAMTEALTENDITSGGKFRLICGLKNGDGTILIDELRFYPQDAVFTSFAYDYRLGHVISICDANSRAKKFAYDGFGRLTSIKNRDGITTDSASYAYFRNSKHYKEPDPIFPDISNGKFDTDTEFENGECVVNFKWNDCGDQFKYRVYVTGSNVVHERADRGINEVLYMSDFTEENTMSIPFNSSEFEPGLYEWYVIAEQKNGDFKITGDNASFHMSPANFFEMYDIRGRFVGQIKTDMHEHNNANAGDLVDKIYASLSVEAKQRFDATYYKDGENKGKFRYADHDMYKHYISEGEAFHYYVDDDLRTKAFEGQYTGSQREVVSMRVDPVKTTIALEPYFTQIHSFTYQLAYKDNFTVGDNHFWVTAKLGSSTGKSYVGVNNGKVKIDKPVEYYNMGFESYLTPHVHLFSQVTFDGRTEPIHHHKQWNPITGDGHNIIGEDRTEIEKIAIAIYIYDQEDGDVDDL